LQVSRGLPRVAIRFQPQFLDFRRGIHVGNLEENQRITRILKLALEERFREPFVTERWGRGVYWQWIGYVPRSNRSAKPISSAVSFGCAKFFLMVDTDEQLFKCGFQVERGYERALPEHQKCELKPDWDWHRLLRSLRQAGPMAEELKRLVIDEGFMLNAGEWGGPSFGKKDFPGVKSLKNMLEAAPADSWASFQVYYPMKKKEIRRSTGVDLVESMMAIFNEVTPAMNLCMQVRIGGDAVEAE